MGSFTLPPYKPQLALVLGNVHLSPPQFSGPFLPEALPAPLYLSSAASSPAGLFPTRGQLIPLPESRDHPRHPLLPTLPKWWDKRRLNYLG